MDDLEFEKLSGNPEGTDNTDIENTGSVQTENEINITVDTNDVNNTDNTNNNGNINAKPQSEIPPSRPEYYSPSPRQTGAPTDRGIFTPPVQPPVTPLTPPAPPYNQGNNCSYYAPPTQFGAGNPYSPYGSFHGNSATNSVGNNNENGINNTNGAGNLNNGKPPKKSKSGIVLAIILAICIVIALVGLKAGLSNYRNDNGGNDSLLSDKDKDKEEDKNTDDGTDDIELVESEEVPLKDKDNNYTVAGVAKSCRNSCVGITVYTEQSLGSYGYYFGNGDSNENVMSGEGSGVLFKESNGKTYIITCAHVISGASKLVVTLDDGTEYDAKLVGSDEQTDIGVISIDAKGLDIASFADSTRVVVGEQVVAIGCPGGLEFLNSVSSGYVSALDRPISSTIGYDNECIQTDAAINPGNSGGALFNMQGQVIGINSSKIASTEYEGMGFAVPSKTAVETANSLIRVGYVEGRAKIGITYNPITNFKDADEVLKMLEEKGYKDAQGTMVIDTVELESDLAGKGIKQYDMIVAVEGKTLTSTDIMISTLADMKPGDTIKLSIARITDGKISVSEVECKLLEQKG